MGGPRSAEANTSAPPSPRAVFRRIHAAILILLAACNYPGVSPAPGSLSVREVRQTLAAITSLPPGAGSTVEPLPIDTPVAPGATGAAQPLRPSLAGTSVVYPDVIQYYAQSGDTLAGLAGRFGVGSELIVSAAPLPAKGLIPPATELWIPNRMEGRTYSEAVFPDGEVVYSHLALDFDLYETLARGNGYLNAYRENVQGASLSGGEIIERVAVESSVNPRLLLALLELRSGWVRSPDPRGAERYPIGFHVAGWEGLYRELVITATHLNAGYYGWREGRLGRLQFSDGKSAPFDPRLNAGSAAVQHLMGKLYPQDSWESALYGRGGLIDLYAEMFGDPWERAARAGPIFPAGIAQPELELPFLPGLRWSLTGGPHPSWKTGSPRGAIDLAPVTGEAACSVSSAWVTAPAGGVVVRSRRNVVVLDLDGDGREQTGWVLVFLHIADHERVAEGSVLDADGRIGHPSCEGGTSTGTHVHIARKFNGEWLGADWPLPFVLGGWQVFAGEKNYTGGMFKGEQEVVASPVGPRTSIIVRPSSQ